MIKIAQLLRKTEKFLNKTNGTESLRDSLDSRYIGILDDENDLVKFQSTIDLIESIDQNIFSEINVKDSEKNLLEEYEEDKEIERQMKLVLEFEIELANVSTTK